MARKRYSKKETKREELQDSPSVSTIPVEENVSANEEVVTTEPIEKSNPRRKRRTRKKENIEGVSTFPDDDVNWRIKMLEGDMVTGTSTDTTGLRDRPENVIMQSTPVGKVFVENERGFKAVNQFEIPIPSKANLERYGKASEEKMLELAVSSDLIRQRVCLLCRGLLGGLALAQIIVFSRNIPNQSWQSFVQSYSSYSQLWHSCWCFLLIVCTVSALDRFDMKTLKQRGVGFMFDPGFMSLLIYTLSMCLTLALTGTQEKFNLYPYNNNFTSLWEQGEEASELKTWQLGNLVLSVAAVIGWVLMGVSAQQDQLPTYLQVGR